MRDPKSYLGEIRILRRRAETLGERLRELRAQATLLSGIDYSKVVVQTSPSDMIAELMGEISVMERRYRDAILDYQRVAEARSQQIHHIGNDKFEEVLERRFIRNQSLDQIADMMGYNYDWIRHVYGDALAEFGRKFL